MECLTSLKAPTDSCLALVPHVNDNIYGPDGISCGVARQYRAEYFVLHSLPVRPGLSLPVNCSKTIIEGLLVHHVLCSNLLPHLLRFLREAGS